MIVLTATTDNIQAVLAGSVTTNQPQCVTSWRDITTTDFTPGRTVINTNNTTDVNIVAAPAASTQRVVDLINIYNKDTVAATVTVKFDANSTEYILWKGSLAAGESVQYVEGKGWQRLGASGIPLTEPGDAYIPGGTDVAVADGGTGASAAAAARTNLDVPVDTWTVIEDATASISPTAADSGQYYRCSHAAPTFNLPTTSLVVGKTHFWLTFTGGTSPGTVDAGSGKTVDNFIIDGGTFNSASADQTVYNIYGNRLCHIRYVATNVWASDIFHST